MAQNTADTRLEIEIRRSSSLPAEHYVLTCNPPSGTVQDPAGACQRLADVVAKTVQSRGATSFLASPGNESAGLCTQVYGGPEVALIQGRFLGAPVNARLTRENGCTMSSFDATMRLLSIP